MLKCEKCGGNRFYLIEVSSAYGTQVGAYCSFCDTWIKWVSKKQLPLFIEEAEAFYPSAKTKEVVVHQREN